MKEGDIYWWRYKEHFGSRADLYWCKSRIAISSEGKLFDTFWNDKHHEELDLGKIDIEYQGNPEEMDKIGKYDIQYFKSEDIVNMNHSNNSNASIYIKKGSKRNQEIMLYLVKQKISEKESSIQFDKNEIDRLAKLIPSIQGGNLDQVSI